MGIPIRLIAVATAAAMLTAMASTVTASAAPASPTTSAPSGDKKDGDKKEKPDKDSVLAEVAAALHVSVRRLVVALDHLKRAMEKGASKADAVRAFARELKISVADAEKALQTLSSDGKQKPDEAVVKLLATELHISAERARQVLKDLEKVKGKDVVKDPAFIAIAKGLGITPERLLESLIKVKQELGGKPKEKVPSESPVK